MHAEHAMSDRMAGREGIKLLMVLIRHAHDAKGSADMQDYCRMR